MHFDKTVLSSERLSRGLFDRLQKHLRAISKPSLKPHQVDASFAESTKTPGGPAPIHRGSYGMSVGFLGEVARENIVQSRFEISLSEKLGFNKTNQGGFDGLTISLDKRGLWLNYDDNKAHTKKGAVRDASAVQENYANNRKEALRRLSQLASDKSTPRPVRVAARLGMALADASRDRVRIQNAGGNPGRTTIPGAQFDNMSPRDWKYKHKGTLLKEQQASRPLGEKYGVKPGTPIRGNPGTKGSKVVHKNDPPSEFISDRNLGRLQAKPMQTQNNTNNWKSSAPLASQKPNRTEPQRGTARPLAGPLKGAKGNASTPMQPKHPGPSPAASQISGVNSSRPSAPSARPPQAPTSPRNDGGRVSASPAPKNPGLSPSAARISANSRSPTSSKASTPSPSAAPSAPTSPILRAPTGSSPFKGM
jgi:hypothetical protein